MSTMTIAPAQVRIRPVADRAPARPAAPRETVRLTRRGRLVVVTGALAFLLGLGLFLGAGSSASERPGTPEPTRVVMVGQGDTLWAIASDAAGGGDVRTMVDRIERLNALDTAMVTAGQRLRIPTTH